MSASDSHPSPTTSLDEIDSLPSSPASSEAGSEEPSDAQKEWEASLQQVELLLTMMVVPYIGRYFGRKVAYWGWARYMQWKYPVEIRVTSERSFKVAGAVEAAATL